MAPTATAPTRAAPPATRPAVISPSGGGGDSEGVCYHGGAHLFSSSVQ